MTAICAHIDKLRKGLPPRKASIPQGLGRALALDSGPACLGLVLGTGRCSQANIGKPLELTQIHQVNYML